MADIPVRHYFNEAGKKTRPPLFESVFIRETCPAVAS